MSTCTVQKWVKFNVIMCARVTNDLTIGYLNGAIMTLTCFEVHKISGVGGYVVCGGEL